MLSMVPLVETLRAIATGYPSPYPRNIYGESFHTAMADEITTLAMAAQSRDYVTVHTEVGEAGQTITVLQKGATDTGITGRAYAASLFEVAAIARLAQGAGQELRRRRDRADPRRIGRGQRDVRGRYGQAVAELQPGPAAALTGQTDADPDVAVAATLGADGRGQHRRRARWRSGGSASTIRPTSSARARSTSTPTSATTPTSPTPDYERLGEKYGEVISERVVLGERLAAAAAHQPSSAAAPA